MGESPAFSFIRVFFQSSHRLSMQPMTDKYVKKLIDNLPTARSPQRLDLVLNGGAFNGSYLAGTLSFLKEMERRDMVRIERISGCSVGAIAALFYCMDSLDFVPKLYDTMKNHLRSHCSLEVLKTLQSQLEEENRIPSDLCDRVNGKLFVCYHDLKRNKKVVKSTFKDLNDVMESIIRSCYIPFFIDHHMVYKKRYMDGVHAHVFPREKGKRVLYIELLSYDKIVQSVSIKNEKTNFHRVLEGLLDIHSFYMKQSNTSMCSFVDTWTWWHHVNYWLKLVVERMLVATVMAMQYMSKFIDKDFRQHILVKIGMRVWFDIFSILMETYCF